MSKKLFKVIALAAVAGLSVKLISDKYKKLKREYAQEEEGSLSDPIKKYTAFFERRLVEVPEGEFRGCELKALHSKLVIDLSRTSIEKEVYISFTAKMSNISIIVPSKVRAELDVNKTFGDLMNYADNAGDDAPVIHVIGNSIASNIEILPENIYIDDEEEEEMDMKEILGEA
ncbi:MAG: hypothetical protein KHZ87_06635 [Clostridiales bacterium]|nr:hypothetical protein [Clostridiales bacterium]MBS5877170.1 hypothetical protein [Clostridiales bacterium]